MKKMNYLVTDLECTCSDSEEFPREEMEIIEIGAVLIDHNLNVIDEFSRFVKPTVNPILTEFCKKLTTIKQSDVDNADELEIALNDFAAWAAKHGKYKFTSWGGFDYRQIDRECKSKRLKNPIYKDNLNYKVRFAKVKKLKRRNGVGIQKALNILNMKFEGTPHRAISDAQNVVRIMKKAGV